MEHQQPHSLPTEPVSMTDLQAKDRTSEHCHCLLPRSREGCIQLVLAGVGDGGKTLTM